MYLDEQVAAGLLSEHQTEAFLPSVQYPMDFVQRGNNCGHDSKLSIESSQHACIGHHPHREVALLNSDNLLPGEASQRSESSLSQPTIEATLPKLLAETMRDKGVVHVMFTLQD